MKLKRQIADKIYKVLSDNTLKETLITCGYDRVKKFDWDITAKKYLEYFENLI